jgi:hypothetical protein
MLHELRTDCRYALRWLRRSPGFTAIAIASLSLGVGFNTALFSIVDALLLRPLSIDQPDRIVDVYTRGGDGDRYATSSYPDFLDLRAQNEVFGDMVAFSPAFAAIRTGDQSRMSLSEVVTGNYFQMLGIRAAVGRTLVADDDRPGAPRVVVISDRLWTRDFARRSDVVGRTMFVHGQPYTVVGVAAAGFTSLVPMLQPDFWMPLTWVEDVEPAGIQDVVPSPTGTTRLDRRGQRWLFVKARLKSHETWQRAEANLQAIMAQLAQAHPKTNEQRPIAVAPNVRVHPEADRWWDRSPPA